MSACTNKKQSYILNDKLDHRKYKLQSEGVSKAYSRHAFDQKISVSMFNCGSNLKFVVDSLGNHKLIGADFCKIRMCPGCQRRRSVKVYHSILKVASEMRRRNPSIEFLFLTLSRSNVDGESLSGEVTELLESWKRLSRRSEFKRISKGWFRSLEVTYSKHHQNYNPHIHALIAVPSYYFSGKTYIKHSRWLELWRESMRDKSIMNIDVRKVKPNPKRKDSTDIAASAAEVAKYASKPGDYLKKRYGSDGEYYVVTGHILLTISDALKGRRLQQVGGDFKLIKSELQLEDEENSDLVDLGSDDEDPLMGAVKEILYRWNPVVRNYMS